MTGRRCIECELFQKRYADLNSAIKDPDVFSRHLISKGFVTDQVATNILTLTGISEYAKVGKFLSTVSSKLTTIKNPDTLKEKFYAFLKVLQEFDQDLSEEISREYSKQQTESNPVVPNRTLLGDNQSGQLLPQQIQSVSNPIIQAAEQEHVLTEDDIVALMKLIRSFSNKWHDIGLGLGFPPSELNQISSNPSLFMSAPASYLKELLSQWVQWPTANHPTKPTLRALCETLRSSLVGLGSLANKVEREMKSSITAEVSTERSKQEVDLTAQGRRIESDDSEVASGVPRPDAEVSTERSKQEVDLTAQGRWIESDDSEVASGVPRPDVGTGSGDDPQPKYGSEKLDEIIDSKEPAKKLKAGDEHFEAVQRFAGEVVLLIQTVNDNETWAVLEYMDGPKVSEDQQLPKPVYFGNSNLILGMFSQYKAALIKTDMGSKCEKKLCDALDELPGIKGLIALGIAWGSKGKCELADVLVATTIVGWNEEEWRDGKFIARDRFDIPMTDKFKEVFAHLPGTWRKFERAADKNLISRAHLVLIISTAKLIDDEKMRLQIVSQAPKAKGGEMEGHVLVQKIQKKRPDLHVAVIKGISDFADGSKHDEWQLTAAMAAVDYAKFMLNKADPDELFN